MTAPTIFNILSPVPIVLIDTVSGLPYRIGQAPVKSALPIPNVPLPVAAIPVDPTTDALYKIP